MSKATHPTSQTGGHETPRQRQRVGHAFGRRCSLSLTSMIDVVFLLLIYFVATASFAQAEGMIIAKMPQTTGDKQIKTEPDAELPLKITLTSSGSSACRINLEGYPAAPTDFRELGLLLKQLRYDGENPSGLYKADHPLVIQADETTRWQHVTNAFNAAVAAEFENVRFSVDQP